MSVLPLRLAPDPILRLKAKRVRNIDGSIQKLVEDMIDSMRASQGVGLAAPQIGVSLRVVVIEVPDQDVLTLINPSIVRRTGERDVQEGCLSIPGYRGEIKRAKTVVAKGLGLDGKEIRVKAQELLAQALEHEIGHIRGVLYTDLLESMDKMYKVEPPKEEEE